MQTPSTRRHASLTALALAVGLAVFAAPPSQAQSLLGQQVHQESLYPTTGNLEENDGTMVVTSAGVTFTNTVDGLSTLVTPTQIRITNVISGAFTSSAFNGLHLSEIGPSPTTITGVTLDPSSTFAGFGSGGLTFDATNVFANFQGLNPAVGQFALLNLRFAPPAAVPEPAPALTFAMAALGLGGLMAVAARRKKASAAD